MTLHEALHSIYVDKGGRLDPDEIERDARDANHPLHDRLEWDDSEAARRYRVEQIAQLIRSVHIVREVHEGKRTSVTVRGWYSTGDDRRYVPLEEVEADPELADQVRQQMKRDLSLLQAKYKAHEVLFHEVLSELVAV